MTQSFYGSGKTAKAGGGGFYAKPAPAHHGGGGILHDIGGAIGHLAGDVKSAVVGIPAGLVTTIEHPIRSAELMGKSEWMMYSPLFHGHFKQFGRNLYDHPLAPMLDIATVFSLGAGGYARLGAAMLDKGMVEDTSLLGRAAKLRQPKEVALVDPTNEGRIVKPRQLSTTPGRRLFQEGVAAVKPHLPARVGAAMDRSAFERAHFSQMAHRHAALGMVMTTAALAGKALSKPETASRARVQIATGLFLNLHRHALAELSPEDAAAVLAKNRHYVYIRNVDGRYQKALSQVRARENRLEARRVANAGAAHVLPSVEKQLGQVQAHIGRLEDVQRRASMSEPVNAAAEARSRLAGKLAQAKTRAERQAIRKQAIAENAMILDRSAGEIARKTAAAHGADQGFGLLKAAERRTRREGTSTAEAQGVHELLLSPAEAAKAPGIHAELVAARKQERALRGQVARSKKAHGIHSATVVKLADTRAVRMNLESRGFQDSFAAAGASPEAFARFNANFANFATTRDIRQAARNDQGLVRVVPKHDATMLGQEADKSVALVKGFNKATNMWKFLQVAATPRTIMNNGVGNWMLYAMRELGQEGSAMAMYDAMRIAHGASKAEEAVLHATPFKRNHWMYRYFGDELGNTFGHDIMQATGRNRVIRQVKQGFYPLVHKLADEPVRMASISAYLRRSPEVKALMKGGVSFDRAATRALRDSRALRDRAAAHAQSVAGDYQTLQPWEQKMRKLVPFYLWDRHIVRSTGNLLLDSPARVAVMQQVSNEGAASTVKYLGSLPEFLQGAVPFKMIGLGGGGGDRSSVLMTQSLNPFGTIGELAGTAEGLTTGGGVNPGDAILNGVNPLITGAVQYATGTSLLTGAPIKRHGGLFTSIALATAEGLPQVRVAEALMSKSTQLTPTGKQKLYTKDRRSPLSALFGVPLKSVSGTAAHAMHDKELHIKKPKKRGKSPFFAS